MMIHCVTDTQTHFAIDEILHIEDLHHTEVFLHITEIAVDLNHIPYTKILTQHPLSPSLQLQQDSLENKDKKYKEVTIDDPHLIITALMNHPVSQMRDLN